MMRASGAILIGLLLTACGAASPVAAPGTGIQGMVEVGPTCPVERINSPCPPHPIAATIVIRNPQGAEVTRVQSGPDGRFKVDLVAGTYSLVGLNVGNSTLPRPIPTSATVVQGRYTAITVEYDSGIR